MAADQLIRTYHKLLSLLAAAITYDGYLSSVERYDPATTREKKDLSLSLQRVAGGGADGDGAGPFAEREQPQCEKELIWSRPIFFFRPAPRVRQ